MWAGFARHLCNGGPAQTSKSADPSVGGVHQGPQPYKPGRAGNGKRVWFGVLCERLRAFAWVSQKPVRGRKFARARTNSPSHERDDAQQVLGAQRRERKTFNIHHVL